MGQGIVDQKNGAELEILLVPTIKVKAVDTSGAGASFLGALSYFMSSMQLSLADAVARANQVILCNALWKINFTRTVQFALGARAAE